MRGRTRGVAAPRYGRIKTVTRKTLNALPVR